MVMTFRKENIALLSKVVLEDEYDDRVHVSERYDVQEFIDFVLRNIKLAQVLEIGPGCGRSFDVYPVTHAVEPSERRLKIMKGNPNSRGVFIKQGFAEAIPFGTGVFDTILFIRGFFQVRSDYEALIEINRCLKTGGVFIVDFSGDNAVFVCGRSWGPNNYVRILNDFGFELVEKREFPANRSVDATRYGVCVRKVRDFDYRYLRKVQFIVEDMNNVKNFFPERDEVLM